MELLSPIVNTLNAPFWDAAEDGRLVLPFCIETGRAFWPPSPCSPYVTAGRVEWRAVEPAGTLRASAVYRRGYLKAFEARMPYGVGLVELDCGPRLQAHIVDPDGAGAPHDGDRVVIRFERLIEGGRPMPTARKRQD